MKTKILATIATLATLCVATATAQNSAVTTDDANVKSSRRTRVDVRTGHELRIGAGAFSRPGYPKEWSCRGYQGETIDDSSVRSRMHYAGSYSIAYVYRFNRLVSFGLTAVWALNYDNIKDIDSGIRYTDYNHYIGFMPTVRLHWFNSRWVELYSAGGIGVGVDYYKSNKPNDSYHDAAFNLRGQITPFGITVGRRLFGFAEFGYGAQGIIVGGIGYKF